MSSGHAQPAMILLVEDDPADQELARRAFRRAQLAVDLHVVDDGQEALDFLAGTVGSTVPTPVLILLDLNMPRMGGLSVLERLSTNETLRDIPVVVLTTSADPEEESSCYDLGASSFLTKPCGLDRLTELVRGLEKYWLCPSSVSS